MNAQGLLMSTPHPHLFFFEILTNHSATLTLWPFTNNVTGVRGFLTPPSIALCWQLTKYAYEVTASHLVNPPPPFHVNVFCERPFSDGRLLFFKMTAIPSHPHAHAQICDGSRGVFILCGLVARFFIRKALYDFLWLFALWTSFDVSVI